MISQRQWSQQPDCTSTPEPPAVQGDGHKGLGINVYNTLIVPTIPEIKEEKEAEAEAEAENEKTEIIQPAERPAAL